MSVGKPDLLPDGVPYVVGEAVLEVLQGTSALAGATVLNNPAHAADVLDGERVVFFEDQGDKLLGQPGQRAQRTYSFTLGVINRSATARRAAHVDYRAAKRVLRDRVMRLCTELRIELVAEGFRELDVRYRLENIDVGGSLVMGIFALDYRDPN